MTVHRTAADYPAWLARIRKPALAIVIATWLGGCATAPQVASSTAPTERTTQSETTLDSSNQGNAQNAQHPPAQALQPQVTAASPAETTLEPVVQPSAVEDTGAALFARIRANMVEPDCNNGRVVDRWIAQYQRRPKAWQRLWLPHLPLLDWVESRLAENDLPSEFALLPLVESDYRPDAHNRTNAGMWQLSTATGRELGLTIANGVDERLDPQRSTDAAIRLLQRLMLRFGDWRLAAMAYNAGEYRLASALNGTDPSVPPSAARHHPPGLSMTTYEYLAKLEALACIVAKPGWHQLSLPQDRFASLTTTPSPIAIGQLNQLSLIAGIDMDAVRTLNPMIGRRMTVPAASSLLLPRADAALVGEWRPDAGARSVASLGSAIAKRHVVKPGDSLWLIARHYRLEVNDLRQWNTLPHGAVLHPGQVLRLEP